MKIIEYYNSIYHLFYFFRIFSHLSVKECHYKKNDDPLRHISYIYLTLQHIH